MNIAEEYEPGLIARSKAGDTAAFNQLVEIYQSRVYNLVLRMLGRAEVAEDVTQDTFTAAYKSLHSFRGPNFRAWLLRIASNACRDRLRSQRRHPELSLDALLLDPGNPLHLPDSRETPEEYVLRQELGRNIQEGLASLPPDQRLVVILSDIQGLSYEEIAQITRSPLGTVKSRLSRGREHLARYLASYQELFQGKTRPHK
ncbi:MAG: sigma-70 family RNA polymerase sigma factor [Chloroflexi bacterium]|nr:sigma-70 family RNA polymerase sigma factor [Chloroflexota bacterium]